MKSFVAVLLRLLSIVLVYTSVFRIPSFLEWLSTGRLNGMAVSPTLLALEIILPIAIAIGIWKFPMTLAGFLVPKDSSEISIIKLDSAGAVALMVIALGLYTLLDGISHFIYFLTLFNVESLNPSFSLEGAETQANLHTTIYELLIGTILTIWGRSIGKAIHKFTK